MDFRSLFEGDLKIKLMIIKGVSGSAIPLFWALAVHPNTERALRRPPGQPSPPPAALQKASAPQFILRRFTFQDESSDSRWTVPPLSLKMFQGL